MPDSTRKTRVSPATPLPTGARQTETLSFPHLLGLTLRRRHVTMLPMKYLSIPLLAAVIFSSVFFSPVTMADEEKTEMTAEEKKAAKEEAKAKKAVKKQLALRKRIAFKKKYKSLKAALSAAKKANVVCYAIYSDPATCPVCIKFEENIIESDELKKLKGVAVCYISRSPLSDLGLTMKPSGCILSPDGKKIRDLHYYPSMSAQQYADALSEACPKLELPEETADNSN